MIDIYLDNNATTRSSPRAIAAVCRAMDASYGNPSSIHRRGFLAREAVEAAREQVAALAGMNKERLCFTSGATEANVAVLSHYGVRGYRLVTTEAEHPAVTGWFERHAPERILTVPLRPSGVVDTEVLSEILTLAGSKALVAMQWANGETGVLQPVDEIAALVRRHGGVLHLDMAQAFGRINVASGLVMAEHASVSAHKLHGPQGVGALFTMPRADPIATNPGGGQEDGRRGGTENVPGIAGFGAACAERLEAFEGATVHMRALRDCFETLLCEALPDLRVNGADAPRVPNTASVTFKGIDAIALAARLEDRGVLCSQVSACSSGSPEPSRTLTAMGLSPQDAFSSLRFAFSACNTHDEVGQAVEAVVDEARSLMTIMGDLA